MAHRRTYGVSSFIGLDSSEATTTAIFDIGNGEEIALRMTDDDADSLADELDALHNSPARMGERGGRVERAELAERHGLVDDEGTDPQQAAQDLAHRGGLLPPGTKFVNPAEPAD